MQVIYLGSDPRSTYEGERVHEHVTAMAGWRSVLLETLVATCRKYLKIVPLRYGEAETFICHLHLSLRIAPGHKISGISRTPCIWAVQVLKTFGESHQERKQITEGTLR